MRRLSSRSGFADTIRWMSSNRATAVPSMASIRSPACSPALAAAPSATTSPITGTATGRPTVANSPANSTAASRKLATGPAATTMARDSTGFSWKVRPGSQLARTAGATSSGRSWPCSFT